MAKMTILEGNSNDKDNVKAYMVKGEPGVSPTIDVSKEDGVTTLTIEDAEGTHTATIADGDDLVGGVPTNGVIGWDSEDTIPDGYEIFDDPNTQYMRYYKVLTTDNHNTIQSYFNDDTAKIIEFETGTYNFDTAFRLNKNTKILLNNSNLIFNVPSVTEDWENSHGFYNFKRDDEFLEYKGNGNISVIGGTITGGSFSFCHAKNIEFKNIEFNLCKNNHILEMCGINGLLVENCIFNGIYETQDNYKECINLDIANRLSFPFFDDENNPTYDNTANKNFKIINNKFINPNTPNYTFNCAIGNHGIEDNIFHENIIIENNIFDNSTNLGIDMYNFKNVIIRNNTFIGSETAVTNGGAHILTNKAIENLLIENNIFDSGYRAISYIVSTAGNKKWKILNNEFINFTHTTSNVSIVHLVSIDLCEIIGNLFRNVLCGCIRTNLLTVNSNNEYYIEKNSFISSNVSISPIKAYDGKSHINQNIFDVTFAIAFSCITLSSDSNVVYCALNKYNDHILTNNYTIEFSSYDNSRKNIENTKRGWMGDGSSLKNQSLNDNLKFSDYTEMILTIGYGGETHTITLTSWSKTYQPYLDARTYKIYFGTGYVEFKINDDTTFDYSQNGTNLQLRDVNLINSI